MPRLQDGDTLGTRCQSLPMDAEYLGLLELKSLVLLKVIFYFGPYYKAFLE